MTWEPLRLDGLTSKVEAGGYGVDAVPAVATDAVRVSERIWSSIRVLENWPNTNEEAASGTIFGPAPAGARGRYVEANIAWQTRGAGADVVTEADPLFRCSGWTQLDGAQKFDYTLAATAHESASCYFYAAGLLIKAVGCRGSLRWDFSPGRLGVMRFLVRGRFVSSATFGLPAGFGYDTTAPLANVGLTFSVGAWNPAIIGCMFDQGAEPMLSEDGNQTDGLGEFDWGEAQPFLTLQARKPALATYDPFVDSDPPPVSRAINATLGTTQFNRLKLALPNTYVQKPSPADSQNMANYDLRYLVRTATPTITSD